MERIASQRHALPFHRPFDWSSMLAFLAARATRDVEVVVGARYLRTLVVDGSRGWLAVGAAPSGDALEVELSPSLARSARAILARARHAFDLDADPDAIAAVLGDLGAARPGLRVPHGFDAFEITVRAILGQQVSVRGASTLAGRFAAAFGESIETPFADLARLPPTAARVAGLDVGVVAGIGMPGARAASIIGLARAVRDGDLDLGGSSAPQDVVAALVRLPGIGNWTAQYVAMRALGWADAFPASDLGVRKALDMVSAREALARAEAWRPYRAYAVMHLWHSLGGAAESPVGG
jgi:AraC family transcriptional regulator, regulatory protein of adaptative response / DNA-3-methyladenine glycosylase II